MDREIKFLRFLLRKNADTAYINVDTKLKEIGLLSDIQTHEFLGSLKKKGYIEWINKRPTTRDSMGGFVVVPDTVDVLLAKITLTGKEHMREDALKNRATTTAGLSFLVAALALIFSIIQWYMSGKKVDKYNKEISVINSKLDSIISNSGKKHYNSRFLNSNDSTDRKAFK